jgi:uncharacterized membrane protein
MQATLDVIGTIMALLAWSHGSSPAFLYGGLLFGSLFPYTVIVIYPTNNKLLDKKQRNKTEEYIRPLLEKWGRLHAVRSIVSFGVFITFLFNL